VRICFLAYWLSAKLELQWRQKDKTIEVHNLLRQLQSIRLARLSQIRRAAFDFPSSPSDLGEGKF